MIAKALVEKETLEDSDLAEIFGPLDKGSGIEVPEPEPTEVPVTVESELVGATVAEAQPLTAPAAQPVVEPAVAKRRWWKRVGVRAPRPSGT